MSRSTNAEGSVGRHGAAVQCTIHQYTSHSTQLQICERGAFNDRFYAQLDYRMRRRGSNSVRFSAGSKYTRGSNEKSNPYYPSGQARWAEFGNEKLKTVDLRRRGETCYSYGGSEAKGESSRTMRLTNLGLCWASLYHDWSCEKRLVSDQTKGRDTEEGNVLRNGMGWPSSTEDLEPDRRSSATWRPKPSRLGFELRIGLDRAPARLGTGKRHRMPLFTFNLTTLYGLPGPAIVSLVEPRLQHS